MTSENESQRLSNIYRFRRSRMTVKMEKQCREEYRWTNTGDYNYDLKSFLGHLGVANEKRNVNWQPGTFMVAKFGNQAIT